MLGGLKLKVCYTHEKTCFAYISPHYSSNNVQSQCIQVLYKEKQLYLWVMFSSNISEGYVACNPIFCRLIGLDEGSEVFVAPYSDVKVLDELFIDTDSPDDQEILEHNAELLQLRILDQLRYVAANQKAIVWISMSLPIVFTPKQTGLLVNQSRVIVEVDVFNNMHRPHNRLKVKEKPESPFKNIGIINNGMLKPYLDRPQKVVLRALPIDSDGKRNLIHPYTVFIHENLIEEKYKDLTTILATIESIPSILENKEQNQCDICVEIIPINNIVYRSLCQEVHNENIPTVLIPKSLNSIVSTENGMKLILTLIGDDTRQPDHIEVVTYSDNVQASNEVIEKFKRCVIQNTHSGKMFLINNGLVKQNTEICDGYLKFNLRPDNLRYTLLNSESFRVCTVSAKCLSEEKLSKDVRSSSCVADFDSYCRTMKCIEGMIKDVVLNLSFEIQREATFKNVSEIKSNVLVTGLSGTGKSTLSQLIQKELTVWSHILHCRSLKGRKDVTEVLSKSVLMCQEHSPSVLICDDVDALVPPNMEGGSPQDIAYYQRLATVIKHILQSCTGVSVLMTATSLNNLHPVMRQFNGKPMFTAHFDMPELNQDDRAELLKHLVNEKIKNEFVIDDDDVTKLAMETAGKSVREITDYLNKIIFKAVKKKKSNSDRSKTRLLDTQTVTSKSTTLDVWAPLGGMKEVKQQLTECIYWPLMYPALFPSQSCGILLYGPPGTGKSYIGSCLAASTQMNFIAVKGPELLSKYIGQSEKAVRDVFDKADMKRPCILFFDEFDSLAPKRGHDSTGVTDRVVNQLLARLDGAEGGAKGPVIAATSRPDLVDPALLRAGRLQRHVYCAPPEMEDRLEILERLAKDVAISSEVDLEDVAQRTEGYSPADLKALLVTAQLGSLEDQLLNKTEDNIMESVVVSKEDLEKALEETKPSLTREQRLFYDMVYKRFRGESFSTEEKVVAMQFQKQKVTLA